MWFALPVAGIAYDFKTQGRVHPVWWIGLAAMVVIDALSRQLPGVLGHAQSAQQDSFAEGLLDCPHYTRPEEFAGRRVPEVLLSGNHEEIRRWRLKQALGRTYERRPDLLEGRAMTAEEETLLAEYIREQE